MAFTSHKILGKAIYKLDKPDKFYKIKGYSYVKRYYICGETVAPANANSEEDIVDYQIAVQQEGFVLAAQLGLWENFPTDVQPTPGWHANLKLGEAGPIGVITIDQESVVGTSGTVRAERMAFSYRGNIMLPVDEEEVIQPYISCHNPHATQGVTCHLWCHVWILIKD
jgi:hypothetical protein